MLMSRLNTSTVFNLADTKSTAGTFHRTQKTMAKSPNSTFARTACATWNQKRPTHTIAKRARIDNRQAMRFIATGNRSLFSSLFSLKIVANFHASADHTPSGPSTDRLRRLWERRPRQRRQTGPNGDWHFETIGKHCNTRLDHKFVFIRSTWILYGPR